MWLFKVEVCILRRNWLFDSKMFLTLAVMDYILVIILLITVFRLSLALLAVSSAIFVLAKVTPSDVQPAVTMIGSPITMVP